MKILNTQQCRRLGAVALCAVVFLGIATLEPAHSAFTATTTSGSAVGAAATFPTYPGIVQRDNPSFYYRLTEGSVDGSVSDAIDASRSGVLHAPYAYNMVGATGDNNGAVRFNGYGRGVGPGSYSTLGMISSTTSPSVLTIECWFKTDTTRGGQLMGFSQKRQNWGGARDRVVYMLNSGKLNFGVWTGSARSVVTSPLPYNDNQWHHVAATFGGGGLRLYVDGSNVVSNPASTTATSYTGYWRIGGGDLTNWPSAPSIHYIDGLLDEFAVYSTELSPARIGAHKTAGVAYSATVAADNPYLYWRLNGRTDSTAAVDASGNGRTGHFANPDLTTPITTGGATSDGNAAALFDGNTSYITGSKPYANPNPATIECWFKTDTAGGFLVGLGDAKGYRGPESVNHDRMLYIGSDGRLNFALSPVSNTSLATLSTPSAYNDDVWHHVVASVGGAGARLYVDGALKASNASWTEAQDFTGYWRIGYERLGDWPTDPAYWGFNGSLDEVAVFASQLDDATVGDHFAARNGAYAAVVTASDPTLYWRLDQATFGANVADSSLSGDTGTASRSYNVAGPAITGPMIGTQIPTTALRVGDYGGAVNPKIFNNPQIFTLEVWMKTTTTTGGKIIGFGAARFGLSLANDRHLYMTNGGKLIFAVYPGATVRYITTPAAYNDGNWHHVVATLGPSGTGASIWVDGRVRISDSTISGAQVYNGYWRIGGDTMSYWPNSPTEEFFRGDLAEVAVYPTVLGAQTIREHYFANH